MRVTPVFHVGEDKSYHDKRLYGFDGESVVLINRVHQDWPVWWWTK